MRRVWLALASSAASALILFAMLAGADSLNEMLGGWGGAIVLVVVPPAIGLACLVFGRAPATCWVGGFAACFTLTVGLLVAPSEVDEPVFPRCGFG